MSLWQFLFFVVGFVGVAGLLVAGIVGGIQYLGDGPQVKANKANIDTLWKRVDDLEDDVEALEKKRKK